MDADISHQNVLHILDLASETAHTLNHENLSLAAVSCAAFDEIFQRQRPILGFVDPRSAVIYMKDMGDRSGETWAVFLKSLKEIDLNPKAINPSQDGSARSSRFTEFKYMLDFRRVIDM